MLENKLGITDSTELSRTEEKISKQKATEMFENGFLEKLKSGTYESLAGIQKYLFDEIYEKYVEMNVAHPLQDGNGRVGRLIMFKECLKYNIVPFIIEDNLKLFYYRGLKEWDNEKGYLTDTCLTAQDKYKAYLDYFRIVY